MELDVQKELVMVQKRKMELETEGMELNNNVKLLHMRNQLQDE